MVNRNVARQDYQGMLVVISILVVLAVGGCAQVVMPMISLEYPPDTPISDITAAAVLALQEHGFSIATVNDSIGIVTTDWADVQPLTVKFLDTLAHSIDRRNPTSLWRMKLSVAVAQKEQRVKMRPVKQVHSNGVWQYANLSETEKKMLRDMSETILLAIDSASMQIVDIVWDYGDRQEQESYYPPRLFKEVESESDCPYQFSIDDYFSPFAIDAKYQAALAREEFTPELRQRLLQRGFILGPDDKVFVKKRKESGAWLLVNTHGKGADYSLVAINGEIHMQRGEATPIKTSQ